LLKLRKQWIKHNQNISAFLICILLISLIVLPFWFLAPIFIDQSIKVYLASQQMDFIAPLKKIFPSLFASDVFANEVGNVLQSFISKLTNSLVNTFSRLILDFPTLSLQLLVIFFTFFFVLKDKEQVVAYVRSLLPFSKDVEKQLFEYSRSITSSVIYGQIIIGVIQGIIIGIGFFVVQVPNALLLTIIAGIASVLPIVGPALVWVPVAIFLIIAGNPVPAVILSLFGIISSSIDNILRPIITSRATRMHSSLVLVGMIGGLFLFGILGLILGPLILAYLLVILEMYRKKSIPGVFVEEQK